ncbi:MAG: hypothetical protein M1348_03535 [Candidatus Parvarchaeota archaeon]|jgi:hypothetical protein|nr:hypothetical protein [Candidatus Parvarchaeota archaeon]
MKLNNLDKIISGVSPLSKSKNYAKMAYLGIKNSSYLEKVGIALSCITGTGAERLAYLSLTPQDYSDPLSPLFWTFAGIAAAAIGVDIIKNSYNRWQYDQYCNNKE